MNLGHDSFRQATVLTALFACVIWHRIQISGGGNPDFGARAVQLNN